MYVYLSAGASESSPLREKLVSRAHVTATVAGDPSLQKPMVESTSSRSETSNDPLQMLIDAARCRNNPLVEETARIFMDHASKLIDVAHMVCSMSDQVEGVKPVRLAAMHIEDLSSQLVDAARILAGRSASPVALENMDGLRIRWHKHVRLLTEAVDDITTMEDFLAISENHILEDINSCIQAMMDRNLDRVDRSARAIRARSSRIINVVIAEMEEYTSGEYPANMMESIRILRDHTMPNFVERTKRAMDILGLGSTVDDDEYELIEQELIEGSSSVYHCIRDIRNNILNNPDLQWSSDDEKKAFADDSFASSPTASHQSSLNTYQTDLEMYSDQYDNLCPYKARQSPAEQDAHMEQQTKDFRMVQRHFQREIIKWDDHRNDIPVLGKRICAVLVEMTDFIRGQGRLRTTADIINAAKIVSECGSNFNRVAKDIAGQCVESQARYDLITNADRVNIYCQQLDVTKKVEARGSGAHELDVATSFIDVAKNLLNVILLATKSAYAASRISGRCNGFDVRAIGTAKTKYVDQLLYVLNEY